MWTEERELAMQIWRKNVPGGRHTQAKDERRECARQIGERAEKPAWLEQSE